MKSKITSFLFFLIVFSFIFSCKNDDVETPLQEFKLSITQDGNQLSHSWTEVNISDFERYILVRSNEPIPANLDPLSNFSFTLETNKVVHQETSKSISGWDEIVLSEETKLFYRVFIELSDRYIASNEIEIDFDKKLIFESAQNSNISIFHHPELKLIYFFDNVDSLFVYDYLSVELTAKTSVFPYQFNNGLFSYGKFNGQDEIYLVPENLFLDNRILILDPISLSQVDIFTTGNGNGTIKAINTEREGLIIVVDDSSLPIKILNRENGDIIRSVDCSCSNFNNIKIDFASTSENILRLSFSEWDGATGTGGFMDFTFSNTWELISETPIIHFQSGLLPMVAYSKNKDYFIPNYNGTIYDPGGNIINSVYDAFDDDGIGYNFVFFENESTLINLTNPNLTNNFVGIRSINNYTLPNLELIDSWGIENIVGLVDDYKLFYDGERLLLSYEIFISTGKRKVVIQSLNL